MATLMRTAACVGLQQFMIIPSQPLIAPQSETLPVIPNEYRSLQVCHDFLENALRMKT